MSSRTFSLDVLPGEFAVCRLTPDAVLPGWAEGSGFFSVTRTHDELSIVCDVARVPDDVIAERGWRALRVAGSLAFTEVGVLAALSAVLAGADVSIFAISTYDTDYLLVQERDLDSATRALRDAGHQMG